MSLQLPPGTCPKCYWHGEYPWASDEGDTYCPLCGAALIDSGYLGISIPCLKCGDRTYAQSKFCSQCGTNCLECERKDCYKWTQPYWPLRDEKETKEKKDG